MQKNKEAVIHFTKIARDRFQIYDFRDKSNKITNTRDLASYLANLRGGQTLDNSFYSKLISMPNFFTIAISKDALSITKKASATKLEPWKLEKTADGEFFVSAIEDEEDKEDLKKCASSNLKHKYVISITAKNEDQKIRTYASIKKSACIPEMCIEINPVSDCVNFDYESEKTPYDVIDEIVGILANVGLVIDPKQIECCHDFCDCGMDQVGPVVPCENNEFILDCYDQKPIVGQSVESLQSYAEAHNRKHFKIYAYDRVVFDSDATIKVKAEDNNKSLFTLYLYSDTDNFVESRDFHTFKEASDSFLQIQKEMADRKTDPVLINYMKIKETTDNGEKVLKSWEGADPGNLIPSEAETEAVVETETKTETEPSTPAPLPTSEAKEEVEEKVETPEGQKLEEKVEETVKASAEEAIEKKAEDNTEYHVEIYTKLNPEDNPEGFDAERHDHNYFKTLEEAKEWANKNTTDGKHYYEISLNDKIVESSEKDINKKAEINADLDVVVDKLEKGDLLKGTAEREEAVERLVKDKNKKEEVKELKEKDILTDEEIKKVKKEASTEEYRGYEINIWQDPGLGRWNYEVKEKVSGVQISENHNLENLNLAQTLSKRDVDYMREHFDPEKKAASNLVGVTITYDNGDVVTTDVNGNQTDDQIREYFKVGKEFNLGNGEEDKMAKVVKVDIDRGNINKESKVVKQDGKYQAQSEKGKNFGTYDTKQEAEERVKQMEMFKHMDKKSETEEPIKKEAEKGTVLVDKNTNEVIKPGESTEGKELKEVEVEKSTTTASNAVYNLFMKSAKINVNAQELRLLTAAYNSNLFKKVAYFGPTAFSFADNDATFIVENGTATCHKTADLTEVEIDKAIKEDPKPATKNEAEDFIKELNKELGVK